ncbi:MAG: tRNA (adenosine(37)-N6)-threonylcarbamoyltransferase complex ATPase subunit type 1 TsaE, partial [Actinomycetales bacterium]
SPTFVLMRSYATDLGIDLVHVDAYRLQAGDEVDDLDIDIATCITAVEWGAQAAPRLADHWIAIDITPDEQHANLRYVSICEVVNESG